MTSYPALLDLNSQQLYPLNNATVFVVGRSQDANLPVADVSCSRRQFRLLSEGPRYLIEALSATSPTRCNGQTVEGKLLLAHGALVQAGNCRFRFLEQEEPGNARAAVAAVAHEQTLARSAPSLPLAGLAPTIVAGADGDSAASAALTGAIPVSGSMLVGRDAGRVQVPLPHVHVSRIHAQLVMQGAKTILSDLNSANGTFVNGQRLRAPATLRAGDRIDTGPYSLAFTGTVLFPQSRENNIALVCRGLKRVVPDRVSGQPLTLLDRIDLVIKPREFVCLLGPSGSGKSTLLSALSARAPADEGAVLLNQRDLYAHFDSLKQDMVVVAQKDILHDQLAVEDALRYTARLRLPADTSTAEVQSCLQQMLETVGLTQQRRTPIRYLSGGQVKRVSLANEILCKPTLVFLDEVTSGLDVQTDREMMRLFRQLADAGKTVVCITHSLANVEQNCHLVVILTNGGRLAFVGAPAEALKYFGIERLGDVYEKLAEKPAEAWQAAFTASPYHQQYIVGRRPPASEQESVPVFRRSRSAGEWLQTFGRQSMLLTRRYLAILLGDRPALATILLQSLAVAALLIILFGDLSTRPPPEQFPRTINLYFLMAIACLWFGCNNTAQEIVKERLIYTRERAFNLLASSYFGSKFVLLAALSGVQALVLAWLVAHHY